MKDYFNNIPLVPKLKGQGGSISNGALYLLIAGIGSAVLLSVFLYSNMQMYKAKVVRLQAKIDRDGKINESQTIEK